MASIGRFYGDRKADDLYSVLADLQGRSAVVEDYGAVGDGVTDDTVAIQAAIDSGKYPVLKNGSTYKVQTLIPNSLGELTLLADNPTGSDKPILDAISSGDICIDFSGSTINSRLVLNGISFTNWYKAANADNTTTGIIQLNVTNCKIETCELGIIFDCKVQNTLVENNKFLNLTATTSFSSAVLLGPHSVAYTADTIYIDVRNNYFYNIINNGAPSTSTHAINIRGYVVRIENNYIDTVYRANTSSGCEAIWVNAADCKILNNYIYNGGASRGAIYTEGETGTNPGYDTEIAYNTLEGDTRNYFRAGIRTASTNDIYIHHNYINNIHYTNTVALTDSVGIYCSSTNIGKNIRIENNTIKNYVAGYGIRFLTAGSGHSIKDNYIYCTGFFETGFANHTGIDISVASDIDGIYIENNTIEYPSPLAGTATGWQGITWQANSYIFNGLNINNNTIILTDTPTKTTNAIVLNSSVSQAVINSSISNNIVIGTPDVYLTPFKQGTITNVKYQNNSWQLDTISVKDYGAVGDGINNDTNAIQDAIAAAAAANKPLYLSGISGDTFLISSELSIPEHMIIEGTGTNCKLLAGANNFIMLDVDHATTNTQKGVLRNFTIDGNTHTDITGIRIATNNYSTENVLAYRCTTGFEIHGGQFLVFWNCTAQQGVDGSTEPSVGWYIHPNVSSGGGNSISCYGGGSRFHKIGMIIAESADNTPFHLIKLENFWIHGNYQCAIYANGLDPAVEFNQVTFEENVYEEGVTESGSPISARGFTVPWVCCYFEDCTNINFRHTNWSEELNDYVQLVNSTLALEGYDGANFMPLMDITSEIILNGVNYIHIQGGSTTRGLFNTVNNGSLKLENNNVVFVNRGLPTESNEIDNLAVYGYAGPTVVGISTKVPYIDLLTRSIAVDPDIGVVSSITYAASVGSYSANRARINYRSVLTNYSSGTRITGSISIKSDTTGYFGATVVDDRPSYSFRLEADKWNTIYFSYTVDNAVSEDAMRVWPLDTNGATVYFSKLQIIDDEYITDLTIADQENILNNRLYNPLNDPITNTGAGAVATYLLPPAVAGNEFIFERDNATHAFIIKPNGSEYFAGSSAGLYKELASDGAYMHIKCYKDGIWHVVAALGTITDE